MQNIKVRLGLPFFFLIALTYASLPTSLGAQSLLQKTDLVYQGAFRVPGGTFGGSTFDYGGTAPAFNPSGNAGAGSLYLIGHDWNQMPAEISIPTLVNSNNINSLATATILQPFTNVTEGNMSKVDAGGAAYCCTVKVGGLMVYGGQLIGTVYVYYDGAAEQRLSHFTSGLNLSASGDFRGMYQVGTQYPGFVSGYMTPVPQQWQSLLGGPALTGNCCLAIAGIQSNGPAASVFDPTNLGKMSPIPAIPVVGYPAAHPLGTGWGTTSNLYNGTTVIHGIVFPQGSSSVLFFGRQGLGAFCYGPGTSDATVVGKIDANSGDPWCYDPSDSSKGTHAYPYAYQVWAYNANDLVAVKRGTKQQWEIVPYATWSFDLPFANSGRQLGGVAYDPATQRIFVSQFYGNYPQPIIHVFQVQSASVATTPAAPSNLTVQ